MAEYRVSKGDLLANGNRELVAYILDQDGKWRRERGFMEVPDAVADARIDALIAGGQFAGRWLGDDLA